MIRNEEEYRAVVGRIKDEAARLAEYRSKFAAEGLDPDQVQRLMDPLISFHEQLVEDVRTYERLLRGEFAELRNLKGLGSMLVGLRIFLGLSQRELADRLNVDASQVSRDERNEYHNISVERVSRILDALGVSLISVLELNEIDRTPERKKEAA